MAVIFLCDTVCMCAFVNFMCTLILQDVALTLCKQSILCT